MQGGTGNLNLGTSGGMNQGGLVSLWHGGQVDDEWTYEGRQKDWFDPDTYLRQDEYVPGSRWNRAIKHTGLEGIQAPPRKPTPPNRGDVVLEGGEEQDSLYSRVGPEQTLVDYLTADPSKADIALTEQREGLITALGGLPTKQERLNRAQERKMQALYASLIAGGAGVLSADPQRGYAASVGEGIKAGLPVAAAGMEDYYEALERADETEVKNLIQQYSLARDATTDEATKRQLDFQILQLSQTLGIGRTTPDFDILDIEKYIDSKAGFEPGGEGETRERTRITKEAMARVTKIAKEKGVQLTGGELQYETFKAIDDIIAEGPESVELGPDDKSPDVADRMENLTVEDADKEFPEDEEK